MRALLFLAVITSGFVGPWWLLLGLGALYAFRYPSYELLFVGFLLDVSYGVGPYPCIYTGTIFLMLLFVTFIKPRLRLAHHAR